MITRVLINGKDIIGCWEKEDIVLVQVANKKKAWLCAKKTNNKSTFDLVMKSYGKDILLELQLAVRQ